MKRFIGAVLGILASFVIFNAGYMLGTFDARHRIAEAIRAGRLTVEQRVDAIADQIESGDYLPAGTQ